MPSAADVPFVFGDFELDPRKCELRRGAKRIDLTPKAFDLLHLLAQNSGRVVTKDEIIQALWAGRIVEESNLTQTVFMLRRALGEGGQQLLRTVPRRGYLLASQAIPAEPAAAAPAASGELQPLRPAMQRVALPMPPTSLIGRDRESAQGAALLLNPDVRLLTLTGTGGSGKTRLAIAIAASVAGQFGGGARFVGLSSITRPDLVLTALANVLEVQQIAHRAVAQLIASRLRDLGSFLLVLDNFEHVLPAATLVSEILASSPSLKVLVTSRARLRIYGEQEFSVAPLEVDSAMALFEERARAVRPTFAMTAENRAPVREICARLDGLPLAIELAAARTRILSPASILERLQSRFQLLTGGAIDLPERQQTLRNTIDWSYGLLNAGEQKLLHRFSAFAGGATLEAVEAVCNTASDLGISAFDGLCSLVEKNLVQRADRPDAEPRFTMLETIREYAAEGLAASGEVGAIRRAQAAYCLVLAEEGNPELGPAERAAWLARCDLEIDNFRSALDWLFQTRNLDWGLRLCMALFRFWDMREHLIEGRARLETILHLAGDGHVRERAQTGIFLGAITTAQGDFASAERSLEQSLALNRQIGDRWGIATSLNALGVSARDRGDYASAQDSFERSLVCWHELGDRLSAARCLHNLANVSKSRGDCSRARLALEDATAIFEELGDLSGAAWSINSQADSAREQGDSAAARRLYERALSMFRGCSDQWGTARSLTDLGYSHCEQAEYGAAHAAYQEALEIFRSLGHRRGIARVLEGFACLAAACGHATAALRLAAAAAGLRVSISAPLPHSEQQKLDRHLSCAWEALGRSAAESAWAEGSAMSVQQAVDCFLDEETPASSPARDR